MNTAVFGGSFNPIHLGHVKLALAAKKVASLDRIILIPTGITPHKSNDEMVDSYHRLQMCRLACSDFDYIEVSDIEINREGKSYTYQTLNSLKEIYPDDSFYMIVGSDMYLTLQSWKHADSFLKGLNIISDFRNNAESNIMQRQSKLLEKSGARSFFIDKPVMDVSSSDIRSKLKNKEDVSSLLDPKVLDYIKKHNLYGV